ncbi:hypothetical protein DAI22_07g215100 [Oryza sativa Japonica Group]|nr:hypothetical protein DAI22_07g215100 [Oryza sativa Japonica Group]
MEGHIMTKTKFVFASTFVTSTLGYSVAIAYSLSGRAAKMSLIRPRPDHVAGTPTNFHGPDRWETGDDPDYASTWLQFTPVIFFHIAIIGHLCLKRPRDVFQLTKVASCFVPTGFALCTLSYFLQFLCLSRYKILPPF